MNIFNIFTKKPIKEADNVLHLPVPEKVKDPTDELFRVGTDGRGWTSLTIIDKNNSMTLTMNDIACRKLINMLKSTLEEEICE